MSRRLEMIFDPKVNNVSGVEQLAAAIAEVQQRTQLAGSNLETFRGLIERSIQAGRNLRVVLNDVAKGAVSVGSEVQSAARQMVDAWNAETKDAEKAAKQVADEIVAAKKKEAYAIKQAREELRQYAAAMRIAGVSITGMGMGVGGMSPGMIGGLMAAGGISAVAKGVFELTSKLGEYAREQQNVASKTGMTTTETQMFGRMAQVTGVNANILTTGMRTLSKAMAENSDEGRKGKQVLKELGLDASIAFEAPGKAIRELMVGLSGVENSFDRERIAIALFGRSGLEILPLVDNFKTLEQQIRATGVVIDEHGIAKSAEYKRALELLGLQWTALKNTVGQGIIGTINFLVNGQKIDVTGATYPGVRGAHVVGQVQGDGPVEMVTRLALSPLSILDQWLNPEGAPGAMKPEFQDPRALLRQDKANQIHHILRSGAGKAGRAEALQFDLKDTESDLAAAIDRQDVGGVAKANADLLRIKQQIKNLTTHVDRAESAVLAYETRMSEKDVDLITRLLEGRDAMIRGGAGKPKLSLAEISRVQAATINPLMREVDKNEAKIREDELKREDFTVKQMAKSWDEVTKSVREWDKSVIDAFHKQVREWKEIRNIQIGSERGDITRQFGRAGRIAELQFSGAGEQWQAIQAAYQIRMQLAKQLNDYELNLAKGQEDQKVLEAKAYADLRKEQQDAEADRELKLLELAKRRKDEFKSLSVSFINAAEQHTLPSFFRQQGQKLQDIIVGNAADMAWGSNIVQNTIKSLSFAQPGTFMGNLLKGTPFAGGAANDPATQVASNTADTVKWLGRIYGALTGTSADGLGIPGVGSLPGFPAGLPGLGTIGPLLKSLGINVPGLTSSGGAFESGSSGPGSINLPFYSGSGKVSDSSSVRLAMPFSSSGPFSFSDGRTSLAAGLFNGTGGSNAAISGIASATALYTGITSALHSFRQGGAQGALGGISSIAGMAALFDPEPISKAVLMGVGAITGIISSLFGDPKANREASIRHELTNNRYYAPLPKRMTIDESGNLVDFSSTNAVRSYQGSWATLPNGGYPQPAVPIVVNVRAIDSKSFIEHGPAIGEALRVAINGGRARPLLADLKQQQNPR